MRADHFADDQLTDNCCEILCLIQESEMSLNSLATLIFLLASVSFCMSAPSGSQHEGECRLIDFNDVELNEELRKRGIGGPWSADEAFAIINRASDILNGKNGNNRKRLYQNEAEELLSILTGEENPEMVVASNQTTRSDPD